MKRSAISTLLAVACFQALAILSGCGGGSTTGGGGGGGNQNQPTIASFTAGAATILNGSSTTLTADFSNGTGVINPGSIAVTSGTAVTVNPTSTTTYTLTVSGTGTPASQSVTVTVDAVPSITSLTPGATTIEAGTSTTLTATFSGGTGVITPGNLTVTSGTAVTVTPTSTTTYTLTVTPPGLPAAAITQTTTVTVTSAPLITSFTSSATVVSGTPTIEAGSSTTLTAVFSGGTGVVTPGNISVTSGTPISVSPTATTTYTLTVTPATGTAITQTTTVAVDPAPSITSFSANPTSVTPGSSSNLTAVFTGGTGVITPGNITVTSGTPVSVSPSATTTYTLTVTPPVGTAITQTTSVTVGTTSISSFNANPVSIEAGQSSNLIAVFSGGTGVITPGNYTVTSGTAQKVSPTATTVYTLTVTPTGGGTALTQNVTVTVYPLPQITSFTTAAANNTLVAGNNTTLTAVFSGGTGVVTPGANGTSGSINVTSGTAVSIDPTLNTTYTLTVTPPIGSAVTQTLQLTVEPSVSVCTSANCSLAPISNQLLGMNLASWYDDVSNATSIVSAFKTAGIAAVRWPGGSWSDGYHWDGQNSYPTQTTIAPASGCDGVNPVGDDTFANFVNDIVTPANLDLAVTANYGSNPTCNGPANPSEAAGWAAYAQSLGTPIHYMTIGNEEYGNWEYDLHTGTSQNNPTVYACEVAGCTNLPSNLSTGLPSGTTGFYSAIKTAVENAGGTASTTLVGVEVNANNTCCATNAANWDSTVLSQAKGSYDFVEFHYYPQNPPNESDSYVVQQGAQNFTANIKTIQSELQAVNEPGTPIYVGEIGSVSSNPGKQSWSITQGLYAAQILGEAMNDGVTRLTWWIGFGNCNGGAGNMSASLYGWQNFGAYNVFSDGTTDYPANSCDGNTIPIGTMSPTAVAFSMFQNVGVKGEFSQQTTVLGDTTDIRAYAATHGTGYALMLFNLNETTAETVAVNVGSESTSSDVQVITYDKQMYDQTDPTCATDAGCSYNSSLTYPAWVTPTTTDMGSQSLPLTLTLQPWSMNVVIVKH